MMGTARDLMAKGNPTEAAKKFSSAATHFRQTGNLPLRAIAKINEGYAKLKGEYQSAGRALIYRWKRNLKSLKESIYLKAIFLRAQGLAHSENSRYRDAVNSFQKAIKLFRQHHMYELEAENYGHLGRTLMRTSKFTAAKEAFKRESLMRGLLGDVPAMASALWDMGVLNIFATAHQIEETGMGNLFNNTLAEKGRLLVFPQEKKSDSAGLEQKVKKFTKDHFYNRFVSDALLGSPSARYNLARELGVDPVALQIELDTMRGRHIEFLEKKVGPQRVRGLKLIHRSQSTFHGRRRKGSLLKRGQLGIAAK